MTYYCLNFHSTFSEWKDKDVVCLFVCVEVLRSSQRNGVMSNAVSLPNHTFAGQA